MLSENTPVTSLNGPVLTISQIINTIMYLAPEADLSGLFICYKAMIPLKNTLVKMGWPQPPSPVQCDNSTATGVTNNTMVNNMLKSMDMPFLMIWAIVRTGPLKEGTGVFSESMM